MNERSKLISRLRDNFDARTAYIKAKLGVLVPSQIRALRLSSGMPRQADLAGAAKLHQSRISMFETPGAANVTLETLSKLAAAFKVGLVVKFVPFSEMLAWENSFSQEGFNPTRIDQDENFLNPAAATVESSAIAVMSAVGFNSLGVTQGKGNAKVYELGNGKAWPSEIGGTLTQTAQLGAC